MILLLGALALGLLLGAERWQWPRLRAVAKATASLCFVAVALAQGALQSAFGLALLAGLGLSLVGDLLLLGERTRLFLAGLGAFALAHAAYAIAFGLGGLHGPMLVLAGLGMAAAAALTLRWLRPHVGAAMRGPVLVYVLIIALMVALALAHALHSGRWPVAAGALLFAASDLAVARERFVQRGFVNKAWGLPAYYAAQLLLAGQAGGAAA